MINVISGTIILLAAYFGVISNIKTSLAVLQNQQSNIEKNGDYSRVEITSRITRIETKVDALLENRGINPDKILSTNDGQNVATSWYNTNK